MNLQLIIMQAIRAIEHDMLDRHGLGDEWERIDAATQHLIKQKWYFIIRNAIENSRSDERMKFKMKYQDFPERAIRAAEAAVTVAFPNDAAVERHLTRDELALIVAAAVKLALEEVQEETPLTDFLTAPWGPWSNQ